MNIKLKVGIISLLLTSQMAAMQAPAQMAKDILLDSILFKQADIHLKILRGGITLMDVVSYSADDEIIAGIQIQPGDTIMVDRNGGRREEFKVTEGMPTPVRLIITEQNITIEKPEASSFEHVLRMEAEEKSCSCSG